MTSKNDAAPNAAKSTAEAFPTDMPPEPQLMSSMPLPPLHYVNFYTDENIRRNRAPRPPPPPVPEIYQIFGIQYNTDDMIRSLESQNIKRLIPIHYDRRKELKKLNHSLLVNFLDLIDVLILNPESSKRVEKVDDLNLLFVHIHHLANEFRPHQARETIRVMMEVQKRLRVETHERFERHLELMRICANNAFKSVERPEILDDDEFDDLNKPEPEVPAKFVDFMTREDNDLCDQLDTLLSS